MALNAGPLWADARTTVLIDLLKLPEIVGILREEGAEYGAFLDEDMLDGRGGPFWAEQVQRIYDATRMEEGLRQALEQGLDTEQTEAAIAFFASEEGQRIVSLENEARRLMSDPQVEEGARAAYEERIGTDDPRLALVARYVAANDLVENNVANAMTSNFHFYLGLSDGGYYKRSEADILAEVWAEQEDIRTDTENWLFGFLLMAYEPLSTETLEAYVVYCDSPAGRALNAALFDGFENLYRDISYALGRGISLIAQGDEI